MIVVSDTSAITALLHIGRASLLADLYGEVFIPVAVQGELKRTHKQTPDFIRVLPVADLAYRARLELELDGGEAEAIVLAKELHADLLLIDEQDGRRVAVKEGLRVIGLLGALLAAKQQGLIPSLREITAEIETKANFRVADQVKAYLFRQAGE